MRGTWQEISLLKRIELLRWGLPLAIAAMVVVYQLGVATYVHDRIGHNAHTAVEILFYSLAGPVVTWLTLGRIEQWLREKEAAERIVRSQERYLASITDASADAILSLNQDGVIQSWNRGAQLMFGYTADEMIGRPLSALLSPELDPDEEARRRGRHLDAQGILRHFETTCVASDGRRVAVDITETPLVDEEGRLLGTSVIMRDITQRKALEAVLEEERARIARDLHDGLAQSLYFMALKLDYIRKTLGQDSEVAARELQALKRTVQSNILDVRRTIFALRPVDLMNLGLVPALRKYVTEFGEQNQLSVELQVQGDARAIPAELEPAFFRLVQEGLNNVAKHARARRANIRLTVDQGLGRLTIEDDGVGFDPREAEARDGHLGLRQMQERVSSLGGAFQVRSSPGEGTTLFAEIPLRGGAR